MNKFIENGFGFPVEILNPTFKTVFGKKVLDVNYKTLSELVLNQLVTKQGRLTGHELKYIVDKMEQTTREFAKPLGTSHAVVLKWQKKGDDLTNMQWTTEKDIRLSVFERFLKDKADYTLSELREYLYIPPDKVNKFITLDWRDKTLQLPKRFMFV